MPDSIIVERGAVTRVRLNRPQVRNALDQPTIAALAETFHAIADEENVRAVLLSGEGKAFCGGADIGYMRASLDWGHKENERDALALSDMFRAIDDCPAPVLAIVHGACLGGGIGLIAVCDIVAAADDALFGFTEAKLGIVPAVISPFVVRKIGQSHARALFPTAERFGAERALRIGLIHAIAPLAGLEGAAQKIVDELSSSGPQAARVAKKIARTVGSLPPDDARTWTAARIADRRASGEGQEGLRAFLEKRKPTWR